MEHIRAMEEHFSSLRELVQESIVGALRIDFLPSETEFGPDGTEGLVVQACMPVDENTCQPFGFLSGGASLALAETLAGYGSMLLLEQGLRPLGASVSANHVSALAKGSLALGIARPLHLGRSTHVWNVDIVEYGCEDHLVSTARVLNHILPKPQARPCGEGHN